MRLALNECDECYEPISRRAWFCPECGAPAFLPDSGTFFNTFIIPIIGTPERAFVSFSSILLILTGTWIWTQQGQSLSYEPDLSVNSAVKICQNVAEGYLRESGLTPSRSFNPLHHTNDRVGITKMSSRTFLIKINSTTQQTNTSEPSGQVTVDSGYYSQEKTSVPASDYHCRLHYRGRLGWQLLSFSHSDPSS